MAVVMVVSAVGLIVDDRTLLGESVWLKPLKFGFAFTLYGLTLAWLLAKLRKGRRFGWWTGLAHAVFSVADIAVITAAAALGTFSHFNVSTGSFNTLVQAVFSYGVPPILLSNVLVAILVLRQRTGDRALNVAIRAGVLLATAGMLVIAFLGPFMDPAPRTALNAAGENVELLGGHGIGGDGHGMAVTNWNADGGDVRIPHFVGLHGIHVLLLLTLALGALAARRAWLRDEKVRARLMTTAAFAHTGLFGVVAWQAARGQSLIHPDTATWTALAAIATLTAVATLVIRAVSLRRLAR
ncbi:hypothetical protein [Phytomonospora endophytica]|nr:hypothetical protein [Phytomonospora endophytica]